MTEEKSEKRLSGFGETFRRYRKSKLAMAGLIVFTIILFFAVGAGLFGTYKESITQHIMEKLQSLLGKFGF